MLDKINMSDNTRNSSKSFFFVCLNLLELHVQITKIMDSTKRMKNYTVKTLNQCVRI